MSDSDPSETVVEDPYPRETINEVLKNLHGSLKWYWQVVMGLSMVKAIETLYYTVFNPASSNELLSVLLFIFVFIPTFIRFYFGDSRYLDEHYIEHRRWRPKKEFLEDTKEKISKSRFLWDIVLLLVIGIIFVFMALSLTRPNIFFSTFFILLFFNTFWLKQTIRLNSNQRVTPIMKDERYKAPEFWIKNNFFHMICILVALFSYFIWPDIYYFNFTNLGPAFYISAQQFALLIICTSNSIFDAIYTKDFYLPSLDAGLDQTLRGSISGPMNSTFQETNMSQP